MSLFLITGQADFTDEFFYEILLITANFIRDLIVLLLIIVANVCITVFLKQYTNRQQERDISSQNAKRVNFNNCVLALILCSMSTCVHLMVFVVVVISFFQDGLELSRPIAIFPVLLNSIKYALNFFIFRSLNKKFRDKFRILILGSK